MQISQEVVDAAHCDQFAATRGLHGLHGFSIGHQRFEGKGALGDRPHKQHAEGVGKSETGCGIDSRGLFLHTSVNSGADYGVGGHRSLLSYVVAQETYPLITFQLRYSSQTRYTRPALFLASQELEG